MGAVLIYSIFTAACGLSQNLWQFAVLRALLGLGMGGVWAAGAALVSSLVALSRSRQAGR